MTREEVEKEAREAALSECAVDESAGWNFRLGYLAAAEPRERELEGLRAEVASMVVQNKDLALIIRGWSQGHDHDQREIAALRACLREFERAIGEHSAPSDCYATGPMTGDSFRDLIQCPACSALAMYRSLMVPPIPLPGKELTNNKESND